jgi:putative ABC transport system permease protein
MLRIALSTLAARKSGTFGALAAVGLAVVLVVSCGILLQSSLRAPIPVERLTAAAIVVQTTPSLSGSGNVSVSLPERTRLPAVLADTLGALPGVRSAVADRSFDTQLLDRDGRVLNGFDGAPTVGHGWESAALGAFAIASGRRPLASDEIVVAADLSERESIRLGDHLQVSTADTRRTFTVVGTAGSSTTHRGLRESPVFFQNDLAARLSGTGDRADLIGILLEPGANEHEAAKRVEGSLEPGLRVLTGATRGEAESPDDALSREDTVAGLTVFGLLAAFVAIFVVASTFALSVQQRHRELALLRAIGSTPRQVRRMIAGEALLVAIAATAVAAPAGVLAAHFEQGLFTRVDMLPEGLHVVIGWLPFAAGLVTAILTTQLAAFASARRASRIRPTDALREASVQRRPLSLLRGLVGLAVVAGGFAVLTASGGGRGGSAPAAALVWMVAVALLGPLLAWPFAWLIGIPLSLFGRAPGLLARANTRANLRRVASIATPVMLAVSLVSTIYFGKTILQRQTTEQTANRTTADYVLQPREAVGLPFEVAASARRVPGVAQASSSLPTSVLVAADGVNIRAFPARGVDASTLAGVIDLGIASGSLADLRGRSLAVSVDSAKLFGWHIDENVHVWLGDGTPASLRVVATFTRPLGFADIVLPREVVERHVSHRLDDVVFVKGDREAERRTLSAARDELRKANPGVEVVTGARYQRELEDAAQRESLAVYVLLGLIVIFCALAVINAVSMSTAERAREFALLRLIGAERRQVKTMIRAETLITLTFGLTIGTIIAIPGLAVLSRDLTRSAVPSVPLWVYFCVVAFYALLGFAASVVPTRLALRMDPVRAMAARE